MAGAGLVAVQPGDRAVFVPEEMTRGVRSEVVITNVSGEEVDYKIRTTAPDFYAIQPSKGRIPPSAALTILITGSGIEAVRPTDRFQIVAQALSSSSPISQTVILGCKMLPSAEFLTMKSVASGDLFESVGGTMEGRRLLRELRAECEEREREVEELKRKVRVLEAGVLSHRLPTPSKSPPSGFSNSSLLLCFLLGTLISLLLPTG